MKQQNPIVISGMVMITFGLIAFYSIQPGPDMSDSLRMIKHSGTFVGLMGIGVLVAGILLYLINRAQSSEPQILEE